MRRALSFVVITLVLFLATPARAIIGGSVVDTNDARFDAVAGFTLDQWRNLNVPTGNAVLIAPDRVVLPRHLINDTFGNPASVDGAPSQYVVRFRVNPNGSRGSINSPSTFYHVRIASWIFPTKRTSSDDLVIGVLETPVTHITPMPIEWRPTLKRGKLAGSLLSWGPDEQGIKGQLRLGGISMNAIGSGTFSWQVGAYGVLNDSGAAAVMYDAQGRARLVGFITTPHAGISFRRWRTMRIMR